MKSSRVVFTMIFGVCITHKRYGLTDYAIVLCMVFGLALFMHADATSSAVFQPAGVVMLVCSIYYLRISGRSTYQSFDTITSFLISLSSNLVRQYL